MDSWTHSSAVHVSLTLSSTTRYLVQIENLNQVMNHCPDLRLAKGLENITNSETTIHRRLAGMCSLSTAKLIEC